MPNLSRPTTWSDVEYAYDASGNITGVIGASSITLPIGPRSARSVVVVGDSLVSNGISNSAPTYIITARNFVSWALSQTKAKLNVVNYAGVGGDRIDQINARWSTDVLPYLPAWVIVEGCSNDIDADYSADTIFTNLKTIVAKNAAIGARTLFVGTSGGNFGTDARHYAYAKLHTYCKQLAMSSNWFSYVPMAINAIDYTTTNNAQYGVPVSGALYDSRHPSGSGALLYYSVPIKNFFDEIYAPSVWSNPLNYTGGHGDNTNLIPNGLMVGSGGTAGTGNSGTVAAGHLGARTGSITSAFSLVARTDGGPGYWQRCTITGAAALTDTLTFGNSFDITTNPGTPTTGDYYIAECDLVATASVGTIGTLEFNVTALNSGFSTVATSAVHRIAAAEYLAMSSWTGRVRTQPFPWPSGGVYIYPKVIITTTVGGACVVDIGDMRCEKVYTV